MSTSHALRQRLSHARAWLRRDPALIQAQRTPFQVLFRRGIVSLRHYPPLAAPVIPLLDGILPVRPRQDRLPVVMVPPLAVNTTLYDQFSHLSLVRYLLAQGHPLYLIDWGRPGREQDHWNLSTYYRTLLPELLEQVRRHQGQRPLALHGWSLGGLLCACHAASARDTDLEALILLGAPCDYHANGALGRQYRRLARVHRWLESRTGLELARTPAGRWRSPGWANSLAFKLSAPGATVSSYLSLLRRLDDHEFVSQHLTRSAFLDDMVAYPGGVMRDILVHLISRNALADGRLPEETHPRSLDGFPGRVLLVTGAQDRIVTPDCAGPWLRWAGDPRHHWLRTEGSHLGIVGSEQAARHIWPVTAAWLDEHSPLSRQAAAGAPSPGR